MKELIITDDVKERFWKRVIKTPDDGCWLWSGGHREDGYAMLCLGHRNTHVRAHIVSWAIHNGPVPDGLCVLHKCDVRGCVKPSDLFLGTKKDNAQDALKKGRLWKQKETLARIKGIFVGEKHPNSKLTSEQVLEIRRLYVPHKYGTERLAKRFGLSQSTVHEIVTRQIWKHLPAS